MRRPLISPVLTAMTIWVCADICSLQVHPQMLRQLFSWPVYSEVTMHTLHTRKLRPEQAGWYEIWEFKHRSNNLSCTGKE